MKIINFTKLLILVGLILTATSCGTNFLDINVDPNNPSKVSLGLLLTNAELTMTNSLTMGNSGISTPASILVHQTVQRGSVDQYFVSGNDTQIQNVWQNLYSGALEDYKTIIDQGTASKSLHYVGIAQVLTAYTFSIMVDLWGDIPFSEALNPTEFRYPLYDDDATIYPKLFALLDQAIENLNADSQDPPGPDDLFYAINGGDPKVSLIRWRQLAKTIKLKLLNQTRLVNDVSGDVNALMAGGDLMAPGGDFELEYGTSTSPNDRNPVFVLEYTLGNRPTYISPYFYEILTDTNSFHNNLILKGIKDPRVPYYWFNQLTDAKTAQNPTEYADTTRHTGFVSIYFSSQGPNQGFTQDRSQTVLGLYPMGGRYDDGKGGVVNTSGTVAGPGNVAQRLLPYFNMLYTQAELMLTEPGVMGDARATFDSAMVHSFQKVNAIASAASVPLIPQSVIDTYIAAVLAKYDVGSNDKKLELILTEKWIASFGFAIDSYTDYRRTGYPKLYDPNADAINFTGTSRNYPVSLAYNATALTLNLNSPGQKNVTTDFVFWDPN